jgi:hypothetical protein
MYRTAFSVRMKVFFNLHTTQELQSLCRNLDIVEKVLPLIFAAITTYFLSRSAKTKTTILEKTKKSLLQRKYAYIVTNTVLS